MRWGVDAAYPPDAGTAASLVEQGYGFIGGYIGGRAEHVWTPADWQRVANAGLSLLPIWVAPSADAPRDQGVADGNAALEAMQAAGLSGLCVLDVENGVDLSTYASGWNDAMHAGSCATAIYGTTSTLLTTGAAVAFDHCWLALWPSSPYPWAVAPPSCDIWQWASGQDFDHNIAWDDFSFATLNPVGS